MPSTLEKVSELVHICRQNSVKCPTLLIVPGLDWTVTQIDQVKRWSDEGCELAGHGWLHRHSGIKTWWHRFHSTFLSRDVAEHLSLSKEGVIQLMEQCGDWFQSNRISLPKLYVPPAWALGDIQQQDLKRQPFQMIETFRGLWVKCETFQPLPLLGFEADTWVRVLALSVFNRMNQFQAGELPIRVGIHPFDHDLILSKSLHRCLAQDFQPIRYDQYLEQSFN